MFIHLCEPADHFIMKKIVEEGHTEVGKDAAGAHRQSGPWGITGERNQTEKRTELSKQVKQEAV